MVNVMYTCAFDVCENVSFIILHYKCARHDKVTIEVNNLCANR